MPFYINRNFENQLSEWLYSAQAWTNGRPLNLGGYTGPSGGYGGPPGGFMGQLPQTRITYDTSEISASGLPASGWSLLDNLNHIRYRIDNIETGQIEVQWEDSVINSNATIINFEGGLSVVDAGAGKVTVTVSLTASGMPAGNSVVTETSFAQLPASGVSNSYSRADHTHGTPYQPTREIVFAAEGILETTSGTLRIYNQLGINFHISKVFLAVATPPSPTSVKINIFNAGVPVFASDGAKPIVASGQYTGYSIAIDNPDFNDGNYLTMNIEQVGGIDYPGTDLTAHITLVDTNV